MKNQLFDCQVTIYQVINLQALQPHPGLTVFLLYEGFLDRAFSISQPEGILETLVIVCSRLLPLKVWDYGKSTLSRIL